MKISVITPSIRKELKLTAGEFVVDEDISRLIIRRYTREAGVRQLKRDFSAIGRKIVRRLVGKKKLIKNLWEVFLCDSGSFVNNRNRQSNVIGFNN